MEALLTFGKGGEDEAKRSEVPVREYAEPEMTRSGHPGYDACKITVGEEKSRLAILNVLRFFLSNLCDSGGRARVLPRRDTYYILY